MVKSQDYYIYLLSAGFSKNHIVQIETTTLNYLDMDKKLALKDDQQILHYWNVGDHPELSYQVQAMLLREGFASKNLNQYQISFENIKKIFRHYLKGDKTKALETLNQSFRPMIYTNDEIDYLSLGHRLKKENSLCAYSAFEQGSRLGDKACTFELAKCYEYARGVSKDLDKAYQYYYQTYETGFFLGVCGLIRVNLKKENYEANKFFLNYFFKRMNIVHNDILSPELQFFNLDTFYLDISNKLSSLEELLEKEEYKKKMTYLALSTLIKDHIIITGSLKHLQGNMEQIESKKEYIHYNLKKEITIFKTIKELNKLEDSQRALNYLNLIERKEKKAA